MSGTDGAFVAWNQEQHVWMDDQAHRFDGRERFPTCAMLPQPMDFVKQRQDDWVMRNE